MKLKKVIVTGFRSVKRTEPLIIDQKTTIFIGANDHGKSNLLHAVLRLNDDKPITEEDINWDLEDGQTPRIEWHFSIEEDKEAIKKLAVPPTASTSPSKSVSEESVEPEMPATPTEPANELLPQNSEMILSFYREGVGTPVQVLSVPYNIPKGNEPELLKLRPRIENFFAPPTTNLIDEVTAAELTTEQFEFMQGIFHLAGIWDKRSEVFTQNDKTTKILSEASEALTKALNDKWNQGKNLTWKLTHSGTNGDHILIQISDPSIESRFTRPSLRSSGFQTFFILSMIISARTKQNPANSYIYLFDEPGTYLHPAAQLDLQRSFEAIADNAQIIYTTHSLFLVNKNYPERNRVISKHKEGTKIDQKPFQKNWKAVRDSLGILMSNNFMIAEKTLLVEGPSDIIYLYSVIKRLKQKGAVDIDLNDLSIVDAGNSRNYAAMAKLMLAEGRSVVALVDGDGTGKKLEEELNKICEPELKAKTLQIHKLPEGSSIEDVCVDLASYREAIKTLANELVDMKVRKFIENLDLDAKIKEINPNVKTLGLITDEITATFFEPNEKISKLSISLKYEDLTKDKDLEPHQNAKTLVNKVKQLLSLRGEKSAEEGVFQEISD